MGQSLRVKHDGNWSTVKAPYILVDGVWKKTFRTHILNGGAWKESHKTTYSNYSIGTGGQSEIQEDGSWTVPDATRYIRVKIWGGSGSGGGAMRSTKYNKTPYGGSATEYVTLAGGPGGSGGYAEVVLETEPGVVFSWTGLTNNQNQLLTSSASRGSAALDTAGITSGESRGTGLGALYLPYLSVTGVFGVNSAFWAEQGQDAPDIVFTGNSPTTSDPYVITAVGGKRGFGAYTKVLSSSWSGDQHYYSMSNDHGHVHQNATYTGYDFHNSDQQALGGTGIGYMNAGTATATGNGGSFAATTLTRGGGMYGQRGGAHTMGSPYYGENGDPGLKGKLVIDTFQ